MLLSRKFRRSVCCQALVVFAAKKNKQLLIIPLEEEAMEEEGVQGNRGDRSPFIGGWLEDIRRKRKSCLTTFRPLKELKDVYKGTNENDLIEWVRGGGGGGADASSSPSALRHLPVNWTKFELQDWLVKNDLGELSHLLRDADGTTLQQLVREWKRESELMASAFWHLLRTGLKDPTRSVFLYLKFRAALESLYLTM